MNFPVAEEAPAIMKIRGDEILLAVAVFLNQHGGCPDESLSAQMWGRFVACSCSRCDDERVYLAVAECFDGGEG